MKSKKEIEQLAEKQYPIEIGGSMWMPNTNDIKKANEQEGYIKGYTQCQEDMGNGFLSLIEEYREKELPDRNVPYHYEAEISSGLNFLIQFIKNKKD
jgi:hypothetical protein